MTRWKPKAQSALWAADAMRRACRCVELRNIAEADRIVAHAAEFLGGAL